MLQVAAACAPARYVPRMAIGAPRTEAPGKLEDFTSVNPDTLSFVSPVQFEPASSAAK